MADFVVYTLLKNPELVQKWSRDAEDRDDMLDYMGTPMKTTDSYPAAGQLNNAITTTKGHPQ